MAPDVPDDALERLSGHISPSFWGRAIAIQLERVEADQLPVLAEVAASQSRRGVSRDSRERALEAHRAVMADAHFLVVAIRQLLRFQDRLVEFTRDPRAIAAADEFRRLVPHARDLRNILQHLDAYAIGSGHLQENGRMSPDEREPSLIFHSTTDPAAEVSLTFGERRITLKATARFAMELADLLHQVWEEHVGAAAELPGDR